MRFKLLTITGLCIIGAVACQEDTGGASIDTAIEKATLHMEASGDGTGDLRVCGNSATDQNGRATDNSALPSGECRNVPNPCGCDVLDVTIDTRTGATLSSNCLDSTGAAQSCEVPDPVVCQLFTISEPDCVVCAYTDGAIIYSTCVAESPSTESCEVFSAGGQDCETCYTENGAIISTTCGNDCGAVACAEVMCGPDSEPFQGPGDCCPTCVPVLDCSQVACPMVMPNCPEGTLPERAPNSCCGMVCVPTGCEDAPFRPIGGHDCLSDNDCPRDALCNTDGFCSFPDMRSPINTEAPASDAAGNSASGSASTPNTDAMPPPPRRCPPGFMWDVIPPACGQCIPVQRPPVDPSAYCQSNADCDNVNTTFDAPPLICVFPNGACLNDATNNMGSTGAECFGKCIPADAPPPMCDRPMGTSGQASNGTATDATGPGFAAPSFCEGQLVEDFDAAGCFTLNCYCADGTISLDGYCAGCGFGASGIDSTASNTPSTGTSCDSCANVQCFVAPPLCDAGFTLSFETDCCGSCVPNACDQIGSVGTAADAANGGSNSATGALWCPQVRCAQGYITQQDPNTCCDTCVIDPNATRGCSNDLQCAPDEFCDLPATTNDPNSGASIGAPALGNGTCLPNPVVANTVCASSTACNTTETCSTELGDCQPAPGSGNGNVTTALCYGICIPLSGACRDSDAGYDPKTAGNVQVVDSNNAVTIQKDICIKDTITPQTGTAGGPSVGDPTTVDQNGLYEMVCGQGGFAYEQFVYCPGGCNAGACLPDTRTGNGSMSGMGGSAAGNGGAQ